MQALYDWKLESWVAAEGQGFDGVFFSEHHFTPYSISPSPNLLVATLAQRTSRMNIGVMANITAFHNPRRLAEEGAMLDHLTGGRLEIGMGRGVDEPEFLREGVRMEETRARFEESVASSSRRGRNRPGPSTVSSTTTTTSASGPGRCAPSCRSGSPR